MDDHWEDEDWNAVLTDMAERAFGDLDHPTHPTIHLHPKTYQAALDLGFRPEDFTAYPTGQEMEVTRDGAGGSYVQISGNPGKPSFDGPAHWEPQQQNDMRPRVVDRAKVKAGRRAARANRKRGRK